MLQNPFLRTFRPVDAIIIAVCCFGIIASVRVLPYVTGNTVEVYRDGRLAARYPLGAHRDETIAGAMGPLTIRISANSVRVIAASCPEKICMTTGSISLPAQQIICAPNHLLITIGGQDISLDAITR